MKNLRQTFAVEAVEGGWQVFIEGRHAEISPVFEREQDARSMQAKLNAWVARPIRRPA